MPGATPVLFITQDDFLWQHWRALGGASDSASASAWLPARGHTLADLRRWREQGRALVVIDAGLPGLPAWQSPEVWRAQLDALHAIVASVRPGDAEGMQVMRCGVRGYCHAYVPAATWTQVLQAVTTGSVWLGASLITRLLHQLDAIMAGSAKTSDASSTDLSRNPVSGWQHDALTERECTIARCVAQGDPNGKIAAAMGISERTVKAHLTTIFEKLGVTDRLQLALRVHGLTAQRA